MNEFEFKKENDLSVIKYPFLKNRVTAIHMHTYPENSFVWTATIAFENDMTEGKQKFREKDFATITEKIKTFIESLDEE